MEKSPEKTGLDLLGPSKYQLDNSAQLIKIWADIAKRGIQDENDLNNLKLSNLTRLGALKKQQERDVLDAAIAANKKLIDQRTAAMKKAVDDEIDGEIKKRQVIAREAAKAANGGKGKALTKAEKDRIAAQVKAEAAAKKKSIDELAEYEKKRKAKDLEKELKDAKKRAAAEEAAEAKERTDTLFGKGHTLEQRISAVKEMFQPDENGKNNGMKELMGAISDMAKQLETQMDEIASKKSAIDTRLQGSSNDRRLGSYWDQMTKDITGFAGISPLIKQSAVADRVADMVGKGIAFNVEQRATLDVVKDKIATTFDAANGTLLRLVKIQQQDTTAGRLGMESALNAFLNNMYETTEYMSTLATSVKSNLEEAMSLMSGENALSFEYQIQKWLGSLSSVGMSDQAIQGLSGVLGQVASGKLDGITNGGQGNLVIMAANQAGLNMSDILNNGLDQNTTNTLMNSMVDYLAKIYNDSGNSKVIQQQIASVYGLSASDLKAAVNLSKSRNVVAKDGLDYNSAMNRLYSMAGSMGSRTSLGEQMSNMWENTKYSMAAGMANNPVTYSLFKMSGLLKDATGGIDFGLPMVMGNGMAMTFNVADLMRVGALSGGIMSSIGAMLGSGGGGGLTGKSILKGIGLEGNKISTVTRGTGAGLSTMGGMTVSESGSMVGNANSDDVSSKTMTDQTDSAKADTASAVDESEDTKLSDVDNHVINILEVLKSISDGNSILKVAVEGGVRITEMPAGRGL
jgi:hypothetical protein